LQKGLPAGISGANTWCTNSIVHAETISAVEFYFFQAARVINNLGALHRHGHMP